MVILSPGATVTGRNFVDRKITAIAPPTRSPTTQPTSAAPTLRPTGNPTPVPTPRPTPIPITKPPTTTSGSCPCSSNSTVPTECEVKLLIKLMDFAVSGEHKLAAQWLRLSFHDAGTFNKAVREGGANGCLMNHIPMRQKDENANLHSAIESLKVVRDSWERIPSTCIDISAADIIQFAGHFSAVRQTDVPGITDAKVSQLLAFKWGRIDEDNCQTDWTFNLPGFELNTDSEDVPLRCMMAGKEIKTKMMDRNGFTAEEATALIGAHTIGLTRNVFGGLAAPWVENGADNATPGGPVFDNAFFDFLDHTIIENTADAFAINPAPFTRTFPSWFQTSVPVELNHLDTDIALAFPSQDTTVHPNFHAHTVLFSSNNQLFLDTFFAALSKMSSLGVTSSRLGVPTEGTPDCCNRNAEVFATKETLARLSVDLRAVSTSVKQNKPSTRTVAQIELTTPVKQFVLSADGTKAVEIL